MFGVWLFVHLFKQARWQTCRAGRKRGGGSFANPLAHVQGRLTTKRFDQKHAIVGP